LQIGCKHSSLIPFLCIGGTIKGCSLAREIGLHSTSATIIVFMVIQGSGGAKELLYYTIIQLVTNNSQNIASLPLRN
jgi:hypothetical protein